MSPFKLIIYLILLLLIIRFLRRFIGRVLFPPPPATASGGQRRAQAAEKERASKMVRCQACGTFITESSALVVGGSGYCSKACAERKLSRA